MISPTLGGLCYIRRLTLLRSGTQQNNGLVLSAIVDAVARTDIDAQFPDAIFDELTVAEVASQDRYSSLSNP